jgi:hypothetical protein
LKGSVRLPKPRGVDPFNIVVKDIDVGTCSLGVSVRK